MRTTSWRFICREIRVLFSQLHFRQHNRVGFPPHHTTLSTNQMCTSLSSPEFDHPSPSDDHVRAPCAKFALDWFLFSPHDVEKQFEGLWQNLGRHMRWPVEITQSQHCTPCLKNVDKVSAEVWWPNFELNCPIHHPRSTEHVFEQNSSREWTVFEKRCVTCLLAGC